MIVNGTKSDTEPVIPGVPQGSVLGPLLFLILISAIDRDVATSFISSFADDTRVAHDISGEDDSDLLQQDLQAVYDWAKANNMDLTLTSLTTFATLQAVPDSTITFICLTMDRPLKRRIP